MNMKTDIQILSEVAKLLKKAFRESDQDREIITVREVLEAMHLAREDEIQKVVVLATKRVSELQGLSKYARDQFTVGLIESQIKYWSEICEKNKLEQKQSRVDWDEVESLFVDWLDNAVKNGADSPSQITTWFKHRLKQSDVNSEETDLLGIVAVMSSLSHKAVLQRDDQIITDLEQLKMEARKRDDETTAQKIDRVVFRLLCLTNEA